MTTKKRPSKKTPAAPEPEKAGGHGVLAGRPDWWGKFILALIQTKSQAAAAAAAGTTKQNAAQVLAHNPELAEEAAEAQEVRRAMIRGALFKIGLEGIQLPLYGLDQRTVIGYETKWDARVLLKLAEAELEECKTNGDGDPQRKGQAYTREDLLAATAVAIEALRTFQSVPRISASDQPPPVRIVEPPSVDRRPGPHSGGRR